MRRLLTLALSTSLAVTGLASASAAAATKVVDRPPTSAVSGAQVGAIHDLAYAGGRLYTLDADTVRVFAPGAAGDAVPQRTVPVDPEPGQQGRALAVGADGTIFVLASSEDGLASTVYRFEANGAGSTSFDNAYVDLVSPIDIAERPGGIALLDNDSNAVFFYGFAQNGQPTPAGGIDAGSNTQTQIFGPAAIDTAPDGRLVVSGQDWVSVFAASANGDVAPQQRLQGPSTQIGITLGAGLDAQGNLYVGSADSWAAHTRPRVLRFSPSATGDVAPLAVLGGAQTALSLPFVEVAPTGDVLVVDADIEAGHLTGPVRTYRAFGGPYAVPASPAALRVSGKAKAAKRTLAWGGATVDADVPVTGQRVTVTCKVAPQAKPKGKGKGAKKPKARTKVVLRQELAAATRSVTVRLGKVRKARCSVVLTARNEVGTSAAATSRFTVRR